MRMVDVVNGWSKVIDWLQDESRDPDIARAQYVSIQKQAPMFYIVFLVFGWALVASHWSITPVWANTAMPIMVTAFVIYRLTVLFKRRNTIPDLPEIMIWRKEMHVLAIVSPALFTIWALVLFPYGALHHQFQVLFIIIISNLVIVFCTFQFRSIAILNSACSNVLFLGYFIWLRDPMFFFFATLGTMASAFALLILNIHYKGFVRLIKTGRDLKEQASELQARQLETERLNDLNYELANHDSMTGLPNHRYLFSELDARVRAASSFNEPFALCLFDLGGLQSINSVYGADVGESIVRQVASRLRSGLGENTFAAHLGDDEFALLLDGDRADPDFARSLFASIFSKKFKLPESMIDLNWFSGFVFSDETVRSGSDLLEKAVYAAQCSNQTHTSSIVVFEPEHERQMRLDADICQTLRSERMQDALSVKFQPIVDIEDGSMKAVECLVRWHSLQFGPVSPETLIRVAEKAGIINKLTLAILKKALAVAANWPIDVSVNLSASNLSSPGFAERVLKQVDACGFDPRRLFCEVTETSIMSDMKEASRSMAVLKNAGVRLSLDDFGTGHSNLTHVHKLPFDCIKVDRSFVSGIEHDTVGYGIVKSLLALSREMDVSCVVEGVETRKELDVLTGLGVRYVQGYYFSKPVDRIEIQSLLASGKFARDLTSIEDSPRISAV